MVRWRLWGGGEGASFFLCLLRIPPLFFSSSFLTTSIKPLPSLPPPPPPPYPFYRLPGNPSQRKDPPSLPPSPSLLFILPSCCFSGGKEKGRKEGKALPNKSPLVAAAAAAAAAGSPFLFAFWVELSLRPWTLSWGPNCARVCSDAKRPHFASPHAIGRARTPQREWKKRAPPANHVSLTMAVQRLRRGTCVSRTSGQFVSKNTFASSLENKLPSSDAKYREGGPWYNGGLKSDRGHLVALSPLDLRHKRRLLKAEGIGKRRRSLLSLSLSLRIVAGAERERRGEGTETVGFRP